MTVEEHSVRGGLGGAVAEALAATRPVPMRILGFPDSRRPAPPAGCSSASALRPASARRPRARGAEAAMSGRSRSRPGHDEHEGAACRRPAARSSPRSRRSAARFPGRAGSSRTPASCGGACWRPSAASRGEGRLIAITNQREWVLLWERPTGRPLTARVGWQCRRGADLCAELRAGGAEPLVRERPGCPRSDVHRVEARWLLDADPALRAAAEEAAPARAPSTAGSSGTCPAGRRTCTEPATPPGRSSSTCTGSTGGRAAPALRHSSQRPSLTVVRSCDGALGESVPIGRLPGLLIAVLTGDSHAALFGLGCMRPGFAKATYGTGTSVMSATGGEPRASQSGLAATVAWLGERPTYALEGNVFFERRDRRVDGGCPRRRGRA